jgi:hypothetical protein
VTTGLFVALAGLLAWATRRHNRRWRLWIAETGFLAIVWAMVADAHWGRRPDPRPWRIYVDSSASMAWADRYTAAKGLAQSAGGSVVYFDSRVHDQDTGPVGTATDYECVMRDWAAQKSEYRGLVLLSDGCAPLPASLPAPVNAAWLNRVEAPPALSLEVPAEAAVGDDVRIKTDKGATVWVLGRELPTQGGEAVWRPEAPSTVSVFARKGRAVVEKRIRIYASDAPYALRLVVGIDPAVPLARAELGPLRVETLQWNGTLWRWQGKTSRTANLPLWIGNAQWLWLDTASWQRLPKGAQQDVWTTWDRATVGLYWCDNAAPLPAPWSSVMPGAKGAIQSWGLTDPDWGPPAWAKSPVLKNLSRGAQVEGAGLALHILGRHRVVQHTGTDWQIGLTRDTRHFWTNLSQWLIDGNRPIVTISADAPRLNVASRVDLQVRDRQPKQLRVIAETIDHRETRVISVTPRSLQDWTGTWMPAQPGLYRITVFGSGEAGDWSAETIANVPGESDEYLRGQVPDSSTLTSMAVNSGGSYQVNELDPAKWVPATENPYPFRARDYPWLLGIAGVLLFLSAHARLNHRYLK